jgi:arginyl-tRNA synthetase
MIRDILMEEIEKAVGRADFDVFKSERFGDYSSNVAMILGKDPKEIAPKIKSTYISKIEIANGFLNFYISEEGLKKGLEDLNKKFPKQKEKISLDYLDANPTGPVHLGHARSGFYGDVLANILGFYGHKVSREFYVNNAKSSGQIQSLGKTALGKGEEYKHEQLLEILGRPEIQKKLQKIKDPKEAGFYIASLIQKENRSFLKKIAKIKFDLFFEEEEVYSSGKVKEIIEKLKKAGTTYEKDGALWLRTSQFGDSEDRVLVRSNGDPTYLLPDIGYHLDRLVKREYDEAVNIFGADHYGYGPRLKGALRALGVNPERVKIITYQMVRLISKGEEIKMSKRKGVFTTLGELIKEVGLDAARYFFLMHSIDSHMDFDLDSAKERSKKNPVYYVQYAGARMHSILAKSQIPKSKLQINPKFQNPNNYERNLILKLIQFPEIIEDIAKDYQVHRLTTYVYELAKVFTDFYENVPVLKAENKEFKKSRLALISVSRNILEKSLSLMGISAPERM